VCSSPASGYAPQTRSLNTAFFFRSSEFDLGALPLSLETTPAAFRRGRIYKHLKKNAAASLPNVRLPDFRQQRILSVVLDAEVDLMRRSALEVDRQVKVVTGATSNTGHSVAETLLRNGERVRVIGRKMSRRQQFAAIGAEPFVAEPTDSIAMRKAMSGAVAAYVMLQPNYIPDSQDFAAFQQSVVESVVPAIAASAIRHTGSMPPGLRESYFLLLAE
jgi:hypothetical protein